MKPFEKYLISEDATLIDALQRLNNLSGDAMNLFTVDADGRVTGSLTDGDVRRALLSGRALNDPVKNAACSDFRRVSAADPDVAMIRECRRSGLLLLPVIDTEGRLQSVINLDHQSNRLPISAVLMAGGKGERLRPLTLDTPKPLLKIAGKAIIDYNIEALAAVGVTDITVTTHHLSDQLDTHFREPISGVQVKTVYEEKPLGTIGALSLVHLPESGSTLVMNSDLITTISFEDMYLHHVATGASITIAVIPYQVSVPFAVLNIEGSKVMGLYEKPSYSYYANAGIYLFDNRLLTNLSSEYPKDAPELITEAIEKGATVGYFPINGTWLDVGTPADFKQAEELLRHHKNFSTR